MREVAERLFAAATAVAPARTTSKTGIASSALDVLKILKDAAQSDFESRFEPLRHSELKRSAMDPGRNPPRNLDGHEPPS